MRTTTVSTSKLRTYKIIMTSILGVCILVLSALTINDWFVNHRYIMGTLYLVYAVVCGKLIKRAWDVKNVSYDDSAVYYDRNGYEVQVPFEDIRDIELRTLDGVYRINLFRAAQDGKAILFKTSLWYPFNAGKQDEMVRVLRSKVDKYKRNLAPIYTEQLPGRRI